MSKIMRQVTPVILSGGSGTRLWPVSRDARPKQFLDLIPGGTTLRQTLARMNGSAFADPLIICNAAHADMVAQQLGEAQATVILEPSARNTAPAIALAALALAPDALMLVCPSDHIIADEAAFHRAVEAAVPMAAQGWMVTFGITPDRPETGYGYIRRGEPLANGVFEVERFVEKPDEERAKTYLEEGCYCWNAGIFLLRADTFLEALDRFAPDMLAATRGAMEKADRKGALILPNAGAFAASPSDSIDYAVMEKAEKVAVVPVDMGWSDIGSWDALYDLMEKDEAGNARFGDVLALDSRNCLIRSDGPVVTVAGVEDLIVVATGDAVMILPRGKSQNIRQIVDALKAKEHPVLKR